MFIIYLFIVNRSATFLPEELTYFVCNKEENGKGGERGKKSSPSIKKRRTVSADFHLHKFSYILVKIIAGVEECSCSVEAGKKMVGSTESPGKGHNHSHTAQEKCEGIFFPFGNKVRQP